METFSIWVLVMLMITSLLLLILILSPSSASRFLNSARNYHLGEKRQLSSSSSAAAAASLPLGTFGWPFIGETVEFISCAYTDSPESFMEKRLNMYGKVFKSHIFGSPTIVSTDPEFNKSVLQSDSKSFVPSYPKSLTELMGSSSILVINGSLHKKIHGLIASFLKSPNLKIQVTKDMHSYFQESMATWTELVPVVIQDQAKKAAFQVLVKVLIGLNPGDEMELLRKDFREFIKGLISLPVKIPGSQLRRSLQAKRRMVKLVNKIISRKRALKINNDREVFNPQDVVDVLLFSGDGQLPDDLISDNMIDLMIPGEDSIPILMTLAVKYLSECPQALQALTEENLRLKDEKYQRGEPLNYNDYVSLPFTQMVITETLRLGNIISGVMRKATTDLEIKGFRIPKGWCVFTYFRSVHLDEDHYDSPYKFNPWRWLDKSSSCYFTPFGGGQRLCPGIDLARLEASVFLHLLVTKFRWEAEKDSLINFPTVRMRKGMPIRVELRKDP